MSKYIDADKLKAKLDEHYRKYQSKYMETRNPYTQGLIDALDLAEQVIDALQQEQPDVDLDADIEMEWDSFNKHLVEYEEKPEEVIWLNWNSFVDIARYFYELGLKTK